MFSQLPSSGVAGPPVGARVTSKGAAGLPSKGDTGHAARPRRSQSSPTLGVVRPVASEPCRCGLDLHFPRALRLLAGGGQAGPALRPSGVDRDPGGKRGPAEVARRNDAKGQRSVGSQTVLPRTLQMPFRVQACGGGGGCAGSDRLQPPACPRLRKEQHRLLRCPGPSSTRPPCRALEVEAEHGTSSEFQGLGRGVLPVTGSVPRKPTLRSRLACRRLRGQQPRAHRLRKRRERSRTGRGGGRLSCGPNPGGARQLGRPISTVPRGHTLHDQPSGREGGAKLGEAAFPSSGSFHSRR